MTERAERPRALVELQSALGSLGVRDTALSERWDRNGWVADWEGRVRGHDVYLLVMGAHNHPDGVRLMLDDFTFEEIRTEHLGKLLRQVFTGDARVVRSHFLRLSKNLDLEVRIDSTTYSASVSGASGDDLSSWAKPLVAP
ncbi:hypothetical protein ACIF8T_23110 [Streptomyces sp. NPDC085946]|uniref:hypothetical protein n=1 Tax=Streptomyces sp. NPDC085946 TaxID=3365744 RepID=UPI0037D6D6A2